MNAHQLNNLYQRAIDTLIKEVEAYKTDASLWEIKDGVTNSGGNLTLHLIGNVNHFIGATLGGTSYKRDRDAEFGSKDLSRHELVKQLNEAKTMLDKVMPGLSDADLMKTYPFDFAGKETAEYYLQFFLGHFQYHLGQINYLRRITNAG